MTFTRVYPMNKQICSANVSIGKPMKGSSRTCYVLDSNEKPATCRCVIGELFIGGDGLAHGYLLNNPELSS